MTRDEAILLILQRCGHRQLDTELQAACVLEMKLAQETKLERADFKPWFLLSEFLNATTGANEPRMPVPTNFLEEHEEGTLWIKGTGATTYTKLTKDDDDTLAEYYLEYAAGTPERYSLVKNYFILSPKPSTTFPLRMRCYLKEPTLTYAYGTESSQTTKTNAWLTEAPDWLIGETGAVIAGQYIRAPEIAAEFKQLAQDARTSLYVQHVAREEMNRTRSQGDD